MNCARCGAENPESAKFCIECATPLQKRCPSCGAENLPRAKFCGECATPLSAPGASPLQGGSNPSATKLTTTGDKRGKAKAPTPRPRPRSREGKRRVPAAERRQLTVMFI